jgi:hypothetical protein
MSAAGRELPGASASTRGMLRPGMDAAPSVDLVWTQTAGGEECIGQNELGAKVQAVLGHLALVPSPEGQRADVVRGSVGREAAGRGWIAVIEVRRADTPPLRRELTFTALDCRQLDDAIVLVVALLLDAAVSNPPPLTIASPAPAISVAIGPDLAIAAGMLPGLSFGFGLVGEAEIGQLWPIVLSAHQWPVSRAMDGASGGQLGAVTFGAATCPVTLAGDGWAIFGCAGASGGEVNSTGVGLDHAFGQGRPYVQIDAQVGLRFRVAGSLVTRLGVGAGFPLIQDTYKYDQADGSIHNVFRTSPVVPGGQVAIELRAPR